MILGSIGFTAPWLLATLLMLPVLWFILRAIPPAPVQRKFPGVALLLGLSDDDTVTDRTPWWLLALRCLAIAAIILGLAGPVLNPEQTETANDAPLLLIFDGSWAGADRWAEQIEVAENAALRAEAAGRQVAILNLSAPQQTVFQAGNAVVPRLAGMTPQAWMPDVNPMLLATFPEGDFETLWLSDGLAYPGQLDLLEELEARGEVTIFDSGDNVFALYPPVFEDGAVQLVLCRARSGPTIQVDVTAHGPDPAGNMTVLASAPATFSDGDTETTVSLVLPAELRARVQFFQIAEIESAGAIALVDDSLRRREIALVAGSERREGLDLLSPLHFLEKALEPNADLLSGTINDVLLANPDVIILADVAVLSEAESEGLSAWAEAGGMLVRFSGPRLAGSDISRREEDPLMPVRLRAGGRTVGGAMSWGEPKSLAQFRESSPFWGLEVPDDIAVSAQVMAQPDPTLAARVIAELNDGTPLITRKPLGQGQVVLFHVTANAEWSNLPLSGLFVQMLERLAISSSTARATSVDLEGTTWMPQRVMDGFGRLQDAGTLPGIDGEVLLQGLIGPDLQPGIYASDGRALAINVVDQEDLFQPVQWPLGTDVSDFSIAPPHPLGGWLLAVALVLLAVDIVASLALSGRLLGAANATARVGAVAMAVSLAFLPRQGAADQGAISAASEVVLAHVLTGDPEVDEIAAAGLQGLSNTLFFRTSIEPVEPASVNLETDELAFYPILYWPITPDQPRPSQEAYAKLNDYMRSGGLIIFDTRDGDLAGVGSATPNGRKLQDLAASLDIPALEPVPNDHVLTRTFYLLQEFPGRHTAADVWVEAAPPGAEQIEGMPFRNLNDGVTPVLIGANDWMSAWAVDDIGAPLLPIGRGFAGERQRELAYRFGVNLIMHVLTGNYKSDQVHVSALLDRLGQ